MNARIASLLVLVALPFAWLPAMGQNMLTVPMEIVRISNPELSLKAAVASRSIDSIHSTRFGQLMGVLALSWRSGR